MPFWLLMGKRPKSVHSSLGLGANVRTCVRPLETPFLRAHGEVGLRRQLNSNSSSLEDAEGDLGAMQTSENDPQRTIVLDEEIEEGLKAKQAHRHKDTQIHTHLCRNSPNFFIFACVFFVFGLLYP